MILLILLDYKFRMDWKYHLLTLELFLMLPNYESLLSPNDPRYRICVGTNMGFTVSGTAMKRYLNLQRRYNGNCTHIDGNLEITNLNDIEIDYDLNFLSTIQEVTGYVLIYQVIADYIPLENLVVIGGDSLYKARDGYISLYVVLNYDTATESGRGLKELRFKSLHEILRGEIRLEYNKQLCFGNTIRWDDIVSNGTFVSKKENSQICPLCHESCNGSCWGSGPDMCQKFTKIPCAQQCDHRCFGKESHQCCHKECVSGCDGTSKSQCWACRHFNSDGMCEESCPPPLLYNQQTYSLVPNPNGKYSFGSLCVDKCPDYLLTQDSACLRRCRENHMEVNKTCVPCEGPCPKTCNGTSGVGVNNFINSLNIMNYRDCIRIDGSLTILPATLEGDPHYNAPPLTISDLNVLRTIREVTDYVRIDSNNPDVRNLSFLSGLTTIFGRVLDFSWSSALTIYNISSLESLELRSLTEIVRGNVVIMENENLCYADTIDFASLVSWTYGAHRRNNKDPQVCRDEDKICDAKCSVKGCWGPGNRNCLECRNYQFEDQCVQWCNPELRIYEVAGKKECKRCHEECAGACAGPDNSVEHCLQNCTHFVDDHKFCVAKCPERKYVNVSTNHCENCNELPKQSGTQNLQVTDRGLFNLTLHWESPDAVFGFVKSYEIWFADSKGREERITVTQPIETYVLEDLTPNTYYNISVQAQSDCGLGPESPIIQSKTQQLKPTAPPQNGRGEPNGYQDTVIPIVASVVPLLVIIGSVFIAVFCRRRLQVARRQHIELVGTALVQNTHNHANSEDNSLN